MTSRRATNTTAPQLLDEIDWGYGEDNGLMSNAYARENKPTYRRTPSVRSFSTGSTLSDSAESEDDDTASSVSLDSILIEMAEEWSSDECESSDSERSRSRERRSSSYGDRSRTSRGRGDRSRRERSRTRKKDRKRSSSLEVRRIAHSCYSNEENRRHRSEDGFANEFMNCQGEFVSGHGFRVNKDNDFMNSVRSIEFEDIADNELNYMGTSTDFAAPSHLSRAQRKKFGPGRRDESPFSYERELRQRSGHKKGKRRKKSAKSRKSKSRPSSERQRHHYHDRYKKTSPIQFRSSLMRSNCEDQPKSSPDVVEGDDRQEVKPKLKKRSSKKKNRISLVMREGMELPMMQGQLARNRRTTGSLCSVASNTNEWMLRDMTMRRKSNDAQSNAGTELTGEDPLAASSQHTQRSMYSRGAGTSRNNKTANASEAGKRRKGLLRAISKRFSKPNAGRKLAASDTEELIPKQPSSSLPPAAYSPPIAKRIASGEVSLESISNEGHRRSSSSISNNCDYVVPILVDGRHNEVSNDLLANPKALRLTSSDGSTEWSGDSSARKADKRTDLKRVMSLRQSLVETADFKTYTPTKKSEAERRNGQVSYSERVMSKSIQLGQRHTSVSPKRDPTRGFQ